MLELSKVYHIVPCPDINTPATCDSVQRHGEREPVQGRSSEQVDVLPIRPIYDFARFVPGHLQYIEEDYSFADKHWFKKCLAGTLAMPPGKMRSG